MGLLCVFVSQYSNKVDFISMGEAQMGSKGSHLKLRVPGPPSCFPWELPLHGTDHKSDILIDYDGFVYMMIYLK